MTKTNKNQRPNVNCTSGGEVYKTFEVVGYPLNTRLRSWSSEVLRCVTPIKINYFGAKFTFNI